MPFNPDDYIKGTEEGFNPDDYLGGSDVAANVAKLGGVRQPDGTFVIPGEGGAAPVHLDAEGNRIGEAPAVGEESTGEAIGNRAVATLASGSQGFMPQVAGVKRGLESLTAPGKSFGEEYRKGRDETKATVEQAREKAGIGYDIAGSVLSGGFLAPETLAGRVALSGGLAAANAAAGSDVDLTKEGADVGKFAKDVGTGAVIGTVAAGVGEGLGYGIRKAGTLVGADAAKALATQTAKDAAAVEKEIASLAGKVGAETQKGSRLIENLQRGTEGLPDIPGAKELAEGVLANNRATLPGQLATIDAAKAAHAVAVAEGPEKAAKMTRDYFAASLVGTEVIPRLKALAPRFGLAAAGMAAGSGFDLATGGDGHSGGFAGAVLGAPGVMQMCRNIAKSPRVQYAVATRLAPMLTAVANSVARGVAPTAAMLTQYVLTEQALGEPSLAAEQLIARGGIKSVLGDNGQTHPDVSAANAPKSELDRAIAQTTGVTLLAGAIDDHHNTMDAALAKVFKGGARPPGAAAPLDLSKLGADPQAMLERISANTGGLSNVAPQVAAEMAATAQRASDYMAKVSAQPPRKGPLAPAWEPSAAEKRGVALASGVVLNPMSVLDAAAAGTLVPEQVAALNAVWPMLGRSMADKALSMLQDGKAVPYKARLMLGFLTDVDIDGTLASIGPNQQAIQANSQKPSNQTPPPTDGSVTLGKRMSERETHGD